MTLWAIVPVKPLRRAKSRLGGVLTRQQRAQLSQEMLINTLDVLASVPQIEQSLVVSRDTRALALAREHHARTVTEEGAPELNQALERATQLAAGYGVSAILVLPADLPLLNKADIEQMIRRSSDPPVVVIAPDRHSRGTNALLIAPAGLIEYDFGPDSFARHLRRAETAGARVEICQLETLGLDLDAPEDLEIYRRENAEKARLKE